MSENINHNRESWLTTVALRIQSVFARHHLDQRKYRVTCGWPVVGGMAARRRVGECHHAKSSKDGTHEIFISPTLDDPLEVAGTLCHELAHVCAGIEASHGKDFVRVCNGVGLTKGKPMSVMPGPRLEDQLRAILDNLGPYPHAALVGTRKTKQSKVTQAKLECVECTCPITLPLKWLSDVGPPTCGCGGVLKVRGSEED